MDGKRPLLQNFPQKRCRQYCSFLVAWDPGMPPGTHGAGCHGGEGQIICPLVSRFLSEPLYRALQLGVQRISCHAVGPDQRCLGVPPPQLVEEGQRRVLDQPSACRGILLFEPRPIRAVPRGNTHSVGIVGSQVDNYRIWLPGSKVIWFLRAQAAVPFPGRRGADWVIPIGQGMVGGIVPAGADAPAGGGCRRPDPWVGFPSRDVRALQSPLSCLGKAIRNFPRALPASGAQVRR